jgi:hypothetical protein
MIPLPLALRRDRGYVYFPDAIAGCLALFTRGSSWKKLKAECYKTSDRRIMVEERFDETLDLRKPTTFAWISWREGARVRNFVLRETATKNIDLYDLVEPKYECEILDSKLNTKLNANLFLSDFHRWAILCKKLYHHADPDGGRRMLLQRIVTLESPPQSQILNETVRLDFMTKDHSMKFSIWQNEQKMAEVIAAARAFG